MTFMQNKMKEKVDNGKVAFGMQLRSCSKRIAEMIALSGFDFIYVEVEHFVCNDETMEDIFRAADIAGCTPIVRLCECSPARITQVLEAGARGVIAPHIETAEEAKAFVEAVKFPPIGKRSGAGSRFGWYGLVPAKEVRRISNEQTLAIAMIESRKAVENLDAILDSGVDMIRVGFSDLSQDMGHIGEPRHPEVIEMAKKIVDTAKAHCVTAGAKADNLAEAEFFAGLGFTHFSLGSDLAILGKQFPNMVKEYNEKVNDK